MGIISENDIYEKSNQKYKHETIIKAEENETEYSSSHKIQTNPSISYNKVLDGVNKIYYFINKNKRLPAVITVGTKTVNMNDMLYLMCKSSNKYQILILEHTLM